MSLRWLGLARPVRRCGLALTVAIAALGAVPAAADVPPPPESRFAGRVRPAWTLHGYGGAVLATAQLGTRIYIGGTFTSVGYVDGTRFAIPYLAAMDATTGRLDPGFAPAVNGAVTALLPSADGSRLYVGGRQTHVAGVDVGRLAAVDPATGTPFSFRPAPNNEVDALAQHGSTLFLGGSFSKVGTATRMRFAAVNAQSGALDAGYAMGIDGGVRSLAVGPAPSGPRLYVAGGFTRIGTTQRYNFASFDLATKSLTQWNPDVRAFGWGIGVSADGRTAYVSTADGNAGPCTGEHERVIALPALYDGVPPRLWAQGGVPGCIYNSGDVNTLAVTPTAIYAGGHLGLENGGSQLRRHLAAFEPATGRLLPYDPHVTGLRGVLSLTVGRAGLLVGGDFGSVASRATSEFALLPLAGNRAAPLRPAAPEAASRYADTVTVGWTGAADDASLDLDYTLYRDNTPVTTQRGPADPNWAFRYVDRGLAAGAVHSYRVRASDGTNASVSLSSTAVTVSGADSPPAYADTVLADQPTFYWRLDESAGPLAGDASGRGKPGTYLSAARFAAPGAVRGHLNPAVNLTGEFGGVASAAAQSAPTTFSVEAFFRTTSRLGGKVVGFGTAQTTYSGSTDRNVYLTNSGQVVFGVAVGEPVIAMSPGSYNDGRWHHVVATASPQEIALYVDGALVATRATTRAAGVYSGYWRVGGDSLRGWPNVPVHTVWQGATPSPNLLGSVDDVAVYATELTPAQVSAHYAAARY